MDISIVYLNKEIVDKYNIPFCGILLEAKEGETKFSKFNPIVSYLKEQFNMSKEDMSYIIVSGEFQKVDSEKFKLRDLSKEK